MYDVIIVGGGPGGLSAALVLGRARRNVLVIDNEMARNFVVNQSHGFLTRDSVSPKKLRQLAREEIEKYETVQFIMMTAERIKKEGETFTIQSGIHTYEAKKVIIATGLKERLSSIKGLKEVYGNLIYSCPYCDGWEYRNKKLVIIGNGDNLLNYVKLIRTWSQDISVSTNGQITCSKEDRTSIKNRQIPIVEDEIVEIFSDADKLKILYSNGHVIDYDAGFCCKQMLSSIQIYQNN
ncbi:NAD(P)/FAD-dependent oxidoreductase [Bacillus sp. JCM 19034]|uniref:NAD(P)/FAD-dependent oxidoreductase n=1 Tax=Bacillus sp. JCM 19034 TaxID=1481928 RepID=UPI000784641D|nr:NAD(P)/FAD-dependent oxidoreductase [Bacillus sp. JCM 19034]